MGFDICALFFAVLAAATFIATRTRARQRPPQRPQPRRFADPDNEFWESDSPDESPSDFF